MTAVVDASVVLAFILDEPGGNALVTGEGPFLLSNVNLAEVLTRIDDRGLSIDDVLQVLRVLPIEHHEFDWKDAIRSARLREPSRRLGLSRGDRACLALADRFRVPVLTADRSWADLSSFLDLDIRLIR